MWFSLSRIVIKVVSPFTALAGVSMAMTSGANASILHYVFEPNSSITLTLANPPFTTTTDSISGSFDFNTLSDTLSAIDVTLSGSPSYFSPSPITFLFPFTTFNSGNTNFGLEFEQNNSSNYLISLNFPSGLGGSSSSLGSVGFYNGPNGNACSCTGGSTSGGVELAAVPLPAALPLFAGGIGAMGFFARRSRRKNAAVAHA
jgi:hypothetical protein